MSVRWFVFLGIAAVLTFPIKAKTSYHYIENTNFMKLPPKLRAKAHHSMTRVLIAFENNQKMPVYYQSRHSQINWQNILRGLSNTLIKDCHAEDGSACFFGGWPSVKSNYCAAPWGAQSLAKAESLKTPGYDSTKYCGDKNLFRCNPLMFGPGLDQSLVDDTLPNVNGKRNNSTPYNAGICVELNGTYNGLSQKCQAASEKLDSIREVPWRESDFFNSDNAEEFKNLQLQIAQQCRENKEKLNADKMCDSLEKSLLLTAAAVEAQKIAGIDTQQLFPQCQDSQAKEPECNEGIHDSYNPLTEALDKLQKEAGCAFTGIQAIESDDMNHMMDTPSLSCNGKVMSSSARNQLTEKDFSLQFFGKEQKNLGMLSIKLNPNMSSADIIRAISEGSNRKSFEDLCYETKCPKSNQPSLAALYGAISEIKTRKACAFPSVQAVDFSTGNNELFSSSKCSGIEGKLATEGLNESGEKVSLILKDKEDKFISMITTKITSSMSKEEIVKAFNTDDMRKHCSDLQMEQRVDPELAREDLQIQGDTFIPPTWNQNNLLARIRNIEGIEKAEIGEDGGLILEGDDLRSKMAAINMNLRASAQIPGEEVQIIIRDEKLYIVPPASAKIEVMANQNSVELSDTEKELLVELERSAIGASSIARTEKSADGPTHLVLRGQYNQGESLLKENEELMDGLFVTGLVESCPSDKAQPCEYTFTAGPKRAPASPPPYSDDAKHGPI